MTALLVFIISLISGFVITTTGFGYAIVMMAILPMFFTVGMSNALTIVGAMPALMLSLYKCRKNIRIKKIFFPMIFSCTAAVFGLVFDLGISAGLYQVLLGFLMIFLSLWFLRFSERIHIPATPLTGSLLGIISGICGALFAINGPPLVLYYNYASENKEDYIACVQSLLFLQTTVNIITRSICGLWPDGMDACLLPVLAGAALGVIPGKLLFDKIDSVIFKKMIYIFMCFSGAYFIYRGIA